LHDYFIVPFSGKTIQANTLPQIQNVIQIKLRMPQGGRSDGVNHARKTGSNEGISAPLSQGSKKEKKALLDEIHQGSPAAERKGGKPGLDAHWRQAG
jgi:hypothetical protein